MREKLIHHAWRGNVRELENTMHRAVLLAHGDEIGPEAIDAVERSQRRRRPQCRARGASSASSAAPSPMSSAISSSRRLHHCLGNRTHAANILGISIRTLRNKLQQYRQEGVAVPLPGEPERASA